MSLLEELKEQRAEAAEHVADLDLEIKASAAALAQDQKEHAEWVQKLADLDRAIAALSPAPSEGDGLGEVEARATRLRPADPFLTEMMEKGGTWHDGGPNPAPDKFVDIYVPAASSNMGDRDLHLEGQPSNAYVWDRWEVAYRVLPIEPAAEAKGEDELESVERYPFAVSYTLENDGWGSCSYETLLEAQLDFEAYKLQPRYLTIVLKQDGEILETFARPFEPDTITISSSSQHAEESARAQDLPPLFPPEPPQPATPESLRAGGIVDSEASWWARKLSKVEA